MTDLDEIPSKVVSHVHRAKKHIQILESGIVSGSRTFVARVALVDLLLQEKQYEQALDICRTAIQFIESHAKEGGYPRTQAVLTFKLQEAAALLRLNRLDEAHDRYKTLADSVSEGVTSFGDLAGCQHVSVRQAALKGLVNVALAQGNRQLYSGPLSCSYLLVS